MEDTHHLLFAHRKRRVLSHLKQAMLQPSSENMYQNFTNKLNYMKMITNSSPALFQSSADHTQAARSSPAHFNSSANHKHTQSTGSSPALFHFRSPISNWLHTSSISFIVQSPSSLPAHFQSTADHTQAARSSPAYFHSSANYRNITLANPAERFHI
jgi:hypothetical protein